MDTKQNLMSVVRCPLSVAKRIASNHGPRTTDHGPRTAFTLVELLVVITIIGILAALIVTAAVGAMKKARETEIKAELNQIDTAINEYKNKTTAYPPNCQTDGTAADAPLLEAAVLNDLKRHMKQAFPRHQEPEDLLLALVGLPTNTAIVPQTLAGGMSAGEAIVFWLGGFSSDPKYPISGEGGPSYRIGSPGNAINHTEDPIENRSWVFPFDVGRLGPRDADGYFDDSNSRFIEYTDPKGEFRRINFWQYLPRKSEQPYLYFDTSRHPAAEVDSSGNVFSRNDPPAATALSPIALHVHALKKVNESTGTNVPPIQYINPDKFQVLHCGIDDAWDEANFERMSVHGVDALSLPTDKVDSYLLFPAGPFIGEVADTIVNFTSQTRIEDAQP